jgi:hypothetical protein
MRSMVGMVLVALAVLASREPVASAIENAEPACLARARAHLPGETMATFVKGGTVGRKRLLFRRGDVLLVIDFEVLEGTTQDFLKEPGAASFPEDGDLVRRFAQALRGRDEVQADLLVRSNLEHERLGFLLAVVLDRGAFSLRGVQPESKKALAPSRPNPDLILRLDYSYECGDRCGTGGRVFFTAACQQLVAVTDWVR